MITPKLPLITPKKATPTLPAIVPKAIVKPPPSFKPLVKVGPPVQRVLSNISHNDAKNDGSPRAPGGSNPENRKLDEYRENLKGKDGVTWHNEPMAHVTPSSNGNSSRNNSLESHFENVTKEACLVKSNTMTDVSSSTLLKKISGKNEFEADSHDIGYTPWMKIENRINQIRSLALSDFKDIAQKDKKELPREGGLYDNYDTHYEDGDAWNKEAEHQLSYGMVQRLKGKTGHERAKSNWKFVSGFIKPRRKPFTSMSELSKHFQKNESKDQHELVKLLLICRDLENTIEEQRTILDMLDHDLREARGILPETLTNLNMKNLEGHGPQQKPSYPTSEIPLFIKGRVFLLPKDHQESGAS